MTVDQNLLLYSLANTFSSVLGVDICDNTTAFLKKSTKIFNKLETDEKMYFTKYSLSVAQSLMNYLKKISLFELYVDQDDEIVYDFSLTWGKNNLAYISLDHGSINVKDIIPEKLMKICKYQKNTNICKEYTNQYNIISKKAYQRIKSKKKYSDLSPGTKNKALLEPMCDLIMNTLSKKRKCSEHLYNHLFSEQNRIVFKLYKNRYIMYDFGKELDNVESFRMKLGSDNTITITFNNKTCFNLCLQTNASEIKEHLSLKFRSNFTNMDELFAVESKTV